MSRTPTEGWDAAIEWRLHDYEQRQAPNALCGLSIVIAPTQQGRGLSELMQDGGRLGAADEPAVSRKWKPPDHGGAGANRHRLGTQ
jgi:hypothetical protein